MARSPVSRSALLGSALALLPAAAVAQAVPTAPSATPPAVVGWLAQPSGTVWVAPGSGQPWQPALANQPLLSGEIVATAPNGETTIGVMASRAILGPSSEFAIDDLGAGGLSATETSGEVALDLSQLPPGARVDIATPRGTVEIAEPGRYEIAAGAEDQPTMVTALSGAASIVNGNSVETVGPGQMATLSNDPNGTIAVAISEASPDPLLRSLIASGAPRPQVALPPAVAEMTGGVNLAAYGTWSDVPAYGTVWFPNVAAGWVPYRDGRWVYAAPWGWTWVDADPWGFAPFHYGRWVQVGPRWGWVPVAPGIRIAVGVPVYAPALVNFFAAGSIGGVGVTITAGALAAGLVGWVPLGPGEFYRPPFPVSPAYIRQVNVYNVHNINTINVNQVVDNRITINHFVNHAALTTVPAAVLADGRPVLPAYHRPPAETLAALRPLPEGAPVHPAPHPVWAEPARPASAPAPLPRRAPEPVHTAATHPPVSQPYHPPEPPVRTAAMHPPEPPRPLEPSHPASLHPTSPQPAHPPVAQPAHPPVQPERTVAVRPPEPPRQPEPYRPAVVHPPAPPPSHPPAEPPRPAYVRPPEPPRQAAPPRMPEEVRAPVRPPPAPPAHEQHPQRDDHSQN